VSKLFIATPVYGPLAIDYTQSILATVPVLEAAGHTVEWKLLYGCCYVHTARNKLARDFIKSGCDELIFIDADIGWQTPDILRLVGHDRAVVGGAAPFRHGVGGFAVNFLTKDRVPLGDPETGLLECDVLPTAMMKIKRQVFFDLFACQLAPLRIEYNRETGEERERYRSFFDFEVDNNINLEFGEDVTFCRKCRRIGIQLWCEPNMTIRHHGMNHREGNLDTHLRALPGGTPRIAATSSAA
jgi:hypothetical protein